MATAEMTAAPTRRLDLSPEQRDLIVSAAGEIIRAAVRGREPRHADPTLGGAADLMLSGTFVSLKRGKHLRGCCGGLQAHAVPLLKSIAESGLRTALDDFRFPPVSTCELEHLRLEVWLLFNPQPVRVRGEERVSAVVTGGKHGLVVERGESRGLLLPGVAAEHDWDSRRFLEQVCVKAGLHPSLWKDDATRLMTFEGEVFEGRVAEPSGNGQSKPVSAFRSEELDAYAEFCRGNIVAMLSGRAPSFYLPSLPDYTVTGVALSIDRPEQAEPLHLAHYSLRPGVPLQSTLYSLAQAAVQSLAQEGMTAKALSGLTASVTILHDPAMHGTVADPDLGGFAASHRAMLVMERSRAGIVFDPRRGPRELLKEAVHQTHVKSPRSAAVFSLAAAASATPVSIPIGPRPVSGPSTRPPGVAGRFYPGEAQLLERMVDGFLESDRKTERWPAAMVPHAGLIYSGRLAASVLRRLQFPETIIVIGPKHTQHGMEWAVAPHDQWSIPGATLASDAKLARRLADAIPGLELDAAAHQQEHAIEVELPFIARLAPRSRVVGIAIGQGDYESCCRFAEGLTEVIRDCDKQPLLLISSDMNHFATDEENRRLDEIAIQALERLDPEDVYETVTGNQISMCGVLPAVIVMETLKRLGGLNRAERVGYATSADVTGDTSRVVGYAGMLFA
jgi:AmmeMemoRadiSam system protein B/AmmeMemoRadiSam system protein A